MPAQQGGDCDNMMEIANQKLMTILRQLYPGKDLTVPTTMPNKRALVNPYSGKSQLKNDISERMYMYKEY